MFSSLPQTALQFMDWPWAKIEYYFQELLRQEITPESVHPWLTAWTQLSDLLTERYARLSLATTLDTADAQAEARYNDFLKELYPHAMAADQQLKQKLLASGIQPKGFEEPLRKMRTEAQIFRQANLPLIAEERRMSSEYNKVIGAQTVIWEGEELTLQQMRRWLQSSDRQVRERAWRMVAERQLADRETLNQLWRRLMELRVQLAENAGFSDYLSYRWLQMLRLDYSPQDCIQFQEAIEQVVVPASTRVYQNHRRRLGVDSLRPWDLDQDLYPIESPPLKSYGSVSELEDKVQSIFTRLDSQLGEYFHIMRSERLLDLDNHKGKAPGAYCTGFPVAQRPFIFMNAVGLTADVRTILHESGHAFHNFERLRLPYAQQRYPGLEFAEVASMAMELLTFPYIEESQGGFFPPSDAKRYQLAHLEHILAFWPYMAVVDAFQHWAYTHPKLASDAQQCDAQWHQLWQRFLPGVDWSGLEQEAMTGWHRKQHIFRTPLYYVEYGLAQLGAVQVWQNASVDQAAALGAYRNALSLGGTVPLPDLYRAAGAKLAFDVETLGKAVKLIENNIQALETA